MKTLLAFAICLLTTSGLAAQQFKGATVTVVLENVLSDNGEILAALSDEATFLKGPGIKNLKQDAAKGAVVLTFENVTPGTYAVSVLHDLNANGQMDFEANGMPKEPYAMSGNSMEMGPPTFKPNAFEVGYEDLEIRIRF